MNLFGNNDCVSRKIKRNLKLEEVTPENDSTFKSYQISYAGTKLDSLINIPKDKFIKDIQLGYSNASLNEDGTINVGDGLKKDLIVFSICTEEGYTLKLILLPHGTVTGEELTEKLATKADLENGKVPNSQLNIDTYLKSSSNNPIANSVVTNNFVKRICISELKSRTALIQDIMNYESSLNSSIHSYPIIATFETITDDTTNTTTDVHNCVFYANKQKGATEVYFTGIPCYNSNSSDNSIRYELHVSILELKLTSYNNNLTTSLYTDTFDSDFIENSLIKLYDGKSDIIVRTKAIKLEGSTISLTDSLNSFIGIFNGETNPISFMEVGTNTKIYNINLRPLRGGGYMLSLKNSLDLKLLNNVAVHSQEIILNSTTLKTIINDKMEGINSYSFITNKSIYNWDNNRQYSYQVVCNIINYRNGFILRGFCPETGIKYESTFGSNDLDSSIDNLLKESSSNFSSCTITLEIPNGKSVVDALVSDNFNTELNKIIKYNYGNNKFEKAKDLTIIMNYPSTGVVIFSKGIISHKYINNVGGYTYRGEIFNKDAGSEQLDKDVLMFDFVKSKVTNVNITESTTINDLTTNINDVTTNVTNLSSTVNSLQTTHKTDITNLTTKLNTKMPVINGGSYQEDEASKQTLITNVNNNTYYDTDGTGVCTINFNNGKFGGSSISNANLVAKVYKLTADNTIEIRGTVTGKYTISGQPKGSLTGDVDGTDDISYVKHYDFDLKWNTSTNKEISYTCKELNVQADLLDTLSYGVRWNSTKSSSPACQRIGNLQMHRDLPIQNALKGCVVKYSADKKPEIQYYLDDNDWRFRKDSVVLKNVTLTSTSGASVDTCTITNNVFSTLQYKNQYFKIISSTDKPSYVGDIYKITDIDTSTKTATAENTHLNDISTQAGEGGSLTGDIELGSCLNGYDGEVMVEVPEFYIRSWEKDNGDKEVRISQVRIDDTWEKQPHCLISPYCVTLLREVPENMGYLSTLPVNSAISVCNTETYCRGGNNSTSLDQYLTSDPFRTNLGKPTTSTARSTMRASCRKSKSKEIMSYNQYKRICYWLYVIEYANFNSQRAYNSKLDSNGFKQGGLGSGVTNIGSEWTFYNSYNPITYNGYTNSLGNGTGRILMTTTMPKNKDNTATVTYNNYVPRWHGIENLFGDIWKNVDGIIINSSSITKDGKLYSEVYTTDNPELYSDNDYNSMNKVGVELNGAGYIKEIYLGDTAEIMPILNDASNATYKCDYHHINSPAGLRTLILGGLADYGGGAGLGCFLSYYGVGDANLNIGFRSASNLE